MIQNTLKNSISILAFILLSSVMMAGGLEKGFEAMAIKDYYTAYKQFGKALKKEVVGANYGMATLHSLERSPYFDLHIALNHCLKAEANFPQLEEKEKSKLQELKIDLPSILAMKESIATKAYKILMEDPSDEALDDFLAHYEYSKEFTAAYDLKTDRVFKLTKERDGLDDYRKFILDYPNARERVLADSLYEMRFFQNETVNGTIEEYTAFVTNYPTSPCSAVAYDSLFANVKRRNTISAFEQFARKFPSNPYARTCWRKLSFLYLRTYDLRPFKSLAMRYPDNVYLSDIEEEMALMNQPRFAVNDSLGYFLIDDQGRRLTRDYYDAIDDFEEGMARVVSDEKVGCVDKSGRLRIPTIYDDVVAFHDNVSVVELDGKFGLIDRWGEYVLPLIFEDLGAPAYNQVPSIKDGIAGFEPIRSNGRIERDFEETSGFKDEVAIVKYQGGYGAIDTLGNWTIPALYDWVADAVNGVSRVKKGDLYGLMKHNVGEMMPIAYQAIGSLRENKRLVAKDDLFGYVNEAGEEVIPMKFDFNASSLRFSEFSSGTAVVSKGQLYGIIDTSGAFILEPKYPRLLHNEGLYFTYQDRNKWGFIDREGHVQRAKYEEAYPFYNGLAIVKEDGLYGMVDNQFQYVLAPEYLSITPLEGTEFYIVGKDSGLGVIDSSGKQRIPLEYDTIEPMNIRFVKAEKEGLTHIYDMSLDKRIWPSE
jgi:hypothetical protein